MADELVPLQGRLTLESKAGWDAFAAAHGLEKSAMMEALGFILAESVNVNESRMTVGMRRMIVMARQIAFDRRSR